MTDRKMLELAAKAAGEWPGPEPFEHVLSRWTPLTDDGDALRLAVKLGLTIDTADGTPDGDIDTPATRVDSGNGRMLLIEVHGTDPYSATRRAIVRAAAAIGKEMT